MKLGSDAKDIHHLQTLSAHNGVVWVMRFSQDGQYLATGGQDGIVRIWQLANAPQHAPSAGIAAVPGDTDPAALDAWTQSALASVAVPPAPHVAPAAAEPLPQSGGSSPGASAAALGRVLAPTPLRTFQGHSEDVLDLHWSAAHFLASASIDKSVRLWHVQRSECLRIFWHHDFVTCVRFHPQVSVLCEGLRAYRSPSCASSSMSRNYLPCIAKASLLGVLHITVLLSLYSLSLPTGASNACAAASINAVFAYVLCCRAPAIAAVDRHFDAVKPAFCARCGLLDTLLGHP